MLTRLLVAAAMATASPALRAADPKPLHALATTGDVTWVAFTPDSKYLLTGSQASDVADERGYELRRWAVETGELVVGPVKGSGVGASGVVSPDGKSVLTGGTSGQWRLWNLQDLKENAHGLPDAKGRIHRVAFHPDGKTYAVLHAFYGDKGAVAYSVSTFDTAGRKPIGNAFDWPAERPRDFVAGRRQTGEPAGWPLTNGPVFDNRGLPVPPVGQAIKTLEVPGDEENCGGPMAVAVSRDGKRAVSAGCNGRVVMWDYPTRKVEEKPLASYPRLYVSKPGLAISADGRRVAVASVAEHGVKGHLLSLTVFDVGTRRAVVGPIELGPTGDGLVSALEFSPDGTVVALAFNRRGREIKQPTNEIQLWAVPAEK